MKKSLIILIVMVGLLTICFGQQTEVDTLKTQAALESANSWLLLVDAGKYAESWDSAAQFFRSSVSKEKWEESLNGILPFLGKVLNREVISATYETSLPGAPDGEYVVIQYTTQFEKKEKTLETVTPMKDEDGIWRVSGYYIK